MTDTAKFRKFCDEDMTNKTVSEIPGVGPIAARKLRSMHYTKATDLYNRLKKLNFDHKKFRVWVQLNCPGAKVATIFKALTGWHRQYGDQATEIESEGLRNSAIPPAQPTGHVGTQGGGRSSLPAPKKTRHSVQFNLSNEHDDSFVNDAPIPDNTLALFFASFSDSCKNILPEFHTEMKMEILRTVDKYEKKTSERQSNASNGV